MSVVVEIPRGRAGGRPRTNPYVDAVQRLADTMEVVDGRRVGTSDGARTVTVPAGEADKAREHIKQAAQYYVSGPACSVRTTVDEADNGQATVTYWTVEKITRSRT